ncbi:MAG TPA: ThiF family adenylyltransferase [Candidatus Angelobacter sp.]|nr:ThiF family adenylyltransferase [Candidatus Angelobacter sp.]
MTPWWEQLPERLKYELEALRKAGIQFDQPVKDNLAGVLSLNVNLTHKGEKLKLRAEYPPFYPYVRFEVFAPDLNLDRHQHPFSKNLCLLGRDSSNWSVEDTLAGILSVQLPKLFAAIAGQNRIDVEGIEEQQAEPFSYYYEYSQNSIVYIDSDWEIDRTVTRGRFRLAIESLSPFRARVVQIEDSNKQELAHDKLDSGHNKTIEGRWIRTAAEIKQKSAELILKSAEQLESRLQEPRWRRVDHHEIDVIGILYSEEIEWRSRADGWLFLVKVRRESPTNGFRRREKHDVYLVRTGRAGQSDLQSRAPELKSIQDKTIALVGAGALGAPVAIECARSGVSRLSIMDSDFFEPGNSVRWPLGFSAVGFLKTDALKNFISQNYPSIEVKPFPYRLGAPISLGGPTLAQYDEFFDGAHLLLDCTAEVGVHYPLSELARERKIPYLAIFGTPGLWGGQILRFIPGKTEGCWNCLCCWWEEKEIPFPRSDPNGEIAPVGCAEPSFTGANYNALQISSFGMRLAADSLAPESEFADDLYDVSFNDDNGTKIPPTWASYPIKRHPKCENH